MSDKKLWEQYVALEKERDTLRSDLAEFQYAAAVANDTIKALQAKVEQMERQEPECEVVGQVRNVLYEVRTLKYDLPAGTKLYALPGAQPAPRIPDDVMRDAKRYRFLRAAKNIPISTEAARDPIVYDAAIDAAMLAAAPEAKT